MKRFRAGAGLAILAAAVAYLPGNLLAKRYVDRSARLLAAAAPPLAAVPHLVALAPWTARRSA
jgi:hypothetical protein